MRTEFARLREPGAARIQRAGSSGSLVGKCEEKPVVGSIHPLPNADMQVKHLCKGKVPSVLWVFSSQRLDHDKNDDRDQRNRRQFIGDAEKTRRMRYAIRDELSMPRGESHMENTKSQDQC